MRVAVTDCVERVAYLDLGVDFKSRLESLGSGRVGSFSLGVRVEF